MHAAYALSLLLLLLLLLATIYGATTEDVWTYSRDSLSDYEAIQSTHARSEIDCAIRAGAAIQLVLFDISSGLCTEFRCRLGLNHCRKCRSANQGSQEVWIRSTACWITVQRRVSKSVDFYRNWTQYLGEFGEGPNGNYWIGLNALYNLTSAKPRRLRFMMKQWSNAESWAEYATFSVGPGSDKYRLNLAGFTATAGLGDSMQVSNNMQFTTFDADHDTWISNCAQRYKGAWWYTNCFGAHANGEYRNSSEAVGGPFAEGLIWSSPYGFYYSLMEIEMLLL